MRVEIEKGRGAQMEVTLRGTPEAVVGALVRGVGEPSLRAMLDALTREMKKRGLA